MAARLIIALVLLRESVRSDHHFPSGISKLLTVQRLAWPQPARIAIGLGRWADDAYLYIQKTNGAQDHCDFCYYS
jgi:hypothetical protein